MPSEEIKAMVEIRFKENYPLLALVMKIKAEKEKEEENK